LTAKTKRAEYINKFKSDTNLSLLLNVQILNEGIDIPICDSVFITDPNNNIENLVQRMSRANRICLTKTECQIYMYCNEKKISKVLDYINANTNNELKDKIYKIRFDNNIPNESKFKYISLNSNKTSIDQNIEENKENLVKYILNNSTIPNTFIDDFFTFYSYNSTDEDIIIDLDLVAKWLNVLKADLKKTLQRSYIENVDYKIILNKSGSKGGRPSETILMSNSCFRRMCMSSNTDKGK
jgi:hypothetical protein